MFRLSPPRVLALGFAGIILLGAIILMLPISNTNGQTLPFVDALFTSTSATCVTGLIVVDTGTNFTLFGKSILLLLIQIGGLGFMTTATLFALVFRKKISLKERLILQEALNQNTLEGIVSLIRKVAYFSFCIEAIGALVFAIRWSFDMPLSQAILYGIFHGISFFNNAGFDIFGPISGPFTSLTSYSGDFVVNFVTMFLITSGGIGFIVISDLVGFPKRRKLSFHSKIVLSVSGALIVFGALFIFLFEYTNTKTLANMSFADQWLASFFQSVSPRTAGANTIDLAAMRQASQFLLVILMFIGASPGSTGGGIKTTTFLVLAATVFYTIKGKEDVILFRRRLPKDRLIKALTITFLALFLLVLVSMILSITEQSASFMEILFEAASAFGTVGLTLGITQKLTVVGKIILCFTMFAGRLGPLTLAYAVGHTQSKGLYRYPEDKVIIG